MPCLCDDFFFFFFAHRLSLFCTKNGDSGDWALPSSSFLKFHRDFEALKVPLVKLRSSARHSRCPSAISQLTKYYNEMQYKTNRVAKTKTKNNKVETNFLKPLCGASCRMERIEGNCSAVCGEAFQRNARTLVVSPFHHHGQPLHPTTSAESCLFSLAGSRPAC